jgi:hypothetical protein
MDRFTVKPPHNFLEGRFELAHSLPGVALELLLEFFSGVQNCPRSSMANACLCSCIPHNPGEFFVRKIFALPVLNYG